MRTISKVLLVISCLLGLAYFITLGLDINSPPPEAFGGGWLGIITAWLILHDRRLSHLEKSFGRFEGRLDEFERRFDEVASSVRDIISRLDRAGIK